jgi:hypothetical protein
VTVFEPVNRLVGLRPEPIFVVSAIRRLSGVGRLLNSRFRATSAPIWCRGNFPPPTNAPEHFRKDRWKWVSPRTEVAAAWMDTHGAETASA